MAAESTGKPALESWVGPELASAVDRWIERHGLALECERLMTTGRSGAIVGIVILRSSTGQGDRRAVLKVDNEADLGESSAVAGEPESAFANHLVSELWPPAAVLDEWIASVQELAGGDLDIWHPLSSLSGRRDSLECVRTVVNALLVQWNPDAMIREDSLSVVVGERAMKRVRQGGLLREWIADQYDDAVLDSPRVRFPVDGPSHDLVNPLYLLLNDEIAASPVKLLHGRSHGDLHADNVLLPIRGVPAPDEFRLIDLSGAGRRSLTDDPANLLLSELERFLAAQPHHLLRSLAHWIVDRKTGTAPFELSGVIELWTSVEDSGIDFATSRGFGAEWRAQFWWSIMSAALVLASRSRLTERLREWFLLLAAIAATRASQAAGIAVPDGPVATVGPQPDRSLSDALEAAARVSSLCSGFNGSVASVTVLSPGALDTWGVVDATAVPWSLLVDFDPLITEEGRPHALALQLGHPLQLITPGQSVTVAHRSTLWVAAAGLAAVGTVTEDDVPLREWRSRYIRGIRATFDRFASMQATPVRVIVFGSPDDRVRAVVEQAIDALGERASLIIVAETPGNVLDAYEPTLLPANAALTVRALEKRDLDPPGVGAAATLPGGDDPNGRVIIPDSQRLWFEEQHEVLHSLVGVTSEAIGGVGIDFYQGRVIAWYELSVGADLPRSGSSYALERALVVKLDRRSTERHTFRHSAGAGGTTLVRRVAWDLHDRYPTLVASQIQDAPDLVARVQELARLTGRSVLVVVENSSERITDAIYEQLRASSVPALLLLSGRGPTNRKRLDLARELSTMSPEEIAEFRRLFTALRPNNFSQIDSIKSDGPHAVPFMFALAAFQDEYVGLDEYVMTFLTSVPVELHDVLKVVALVHRYGGVSIQASAFASTLGFPLDEPARLARRLGDAADGLLLEEHPGYWRTVHSLVAGAVLQALLAPKVGHAADGPDGWRMRLPSAALDLIDAVASACRDVLTDDMRTVLERTFIRRDNYESAKERYSELVTELRSEARGQIFQRLTESFPEEPHFWAHFGRWLSFDARDHGRAREQMNEALRLNEDDALLWHMRGTATRRELYDFLDAHRRREVSEADEKEVVGHVETLAYDALRDFAKAWQLDDTSDYPLFTTADLCIRAIEWGKRRTDAPTYADFLRRPSSAFFGHLLDEAEIAMDRVDELRADDALSDKFAQLEARLRGVYDDFPAMISGFRNLIDSAGDVARLSLRTRVARLYGARRGGWNLATPADIDSAVQLLNDNLKDDPTDPQTARLWLQAARYRNTSLERAAEVVSNWVEFDKSRDALYYDYVITALSALAGGLTSAQDLDEKLGRLRARSQFFGARRSMVDWLGTGDGLQRLLHKSVLGKWERRTDPPPNVLDRIHGRVLDIKSNTSGSIELEGGVLAFFTPVVAGIRPGETNVPVTAVVGFSFDGAQAWSVARRT